MKYWLIRCPQGHCGTGKYREITFAFKAKNLVSAMGIAMRMPSIKHHRVPLYAKEISKEEYDELK